MKIVRDTKVPSIVQCQNMAANLRDKLGCCVFIRPEISAYHTEGEKSEGLTFWLDPKPSGPGYLIYTWQELLTKYHKLMK